MSRDRRSYRALINSNRRCLRLVLGDIGEIVEDQQTTFVEFGDCGFQGEIAARDLKFLDEIVVLVKRTRQPFSIKARPSAAARRDFPAPGGRSTRDRLPFRAMRRLPRSACTCAFEIIGTAVKSNVSRVSSRRQSCFLQMPFEAAAASLHHLLFGEGRQESGGRSALPCRRSPPGRPRSARCRQSQLAEQQVDASRRRSCRSPSCRFSNACRDLIVDGEGGQPDDDERNGASFGRKRSISAARSGRTPSSRPACNARARSASQERSNASARRPTMARQAGRSPRPASKASNARAKARRGRADRDRRD